MFTNVGHKIQVLAKVICWIGIAAAFISGIVIIVYGGKLISLESSYRSYYSSYSSRSPFSEYGTLIIVGGFLWILIGSLISWIGSFKLYAYGVMTENTDSLTTLTIENSKEIRRISDMVFRMEKAQSKDI